MTGKLRVGGHSHTVTIDYDGTALAVDIGFIVYNTLNYPGPHRDVRAFEVETIESCMTFAVSADRGKFEWKGGGNTWLDTARRTFYNGAICFRRLTCECCATFFASTITALRILPKANSQACPSGITSAQSFLPAVLTDYLAPMGAAIWSAPAERDDGFPGRKFRRLFSNHRLLQYDRPVWRTVKGGSRSYVEKLTAPSATRSGWLRVTSIERTLAASRP